MGLLADVIHTPPASFDTSELPDKLWKDGLAGEGLTMLMTLKLPDLLFKQAIDHAKESHDTCLLAFLNFVMNLVSLANKIGAVFHIKYALLPDRKLTKRRISGFQVDAVNTLYHAMKAVVDGTLPTPTTELQATLKEDYFDAENVVKKTSDYVNKLLDTVAISWQSDARLLVGEMEKLMGDDELQSKGDEVMGDAELQSKLLAIDSVKLSTYTKELDSQLALLAKASIAINAEMHTKAKKQVEAAKDIVLFHYVVDSCKKLEQKKDEQPDMDMGSAVAAVRKDKQKQKQKQKNIDKHT